MLEESPWREAVAFLVDPVLPVLAIVILAWLAIRFTRVFVKGLIGALLDREVAEGTMQELSAVEVQKRKETLQSLIANVVQVFIVLIASVMILSKLRFDIGPAVAGLGVVGIAVGFGAQSLVRDYFTGALILIENQFSKGDTVSIAGVTGTVEDFSLRRTTLRDVDGVVHTVPNGEIKVASNRTRVWARIRLDLAFPFNADVDAAIKIVDRVGRQMNAEDEWKRALLEPPRVVGIGHLGASVTIQVRGRVVATREDEASHELRRLVYQRLREAGITPEGL